MANSHRQLGEGAAPKPPSPSIEHPTQLPASSHEPPLLSLSAVKKIQKTVAFRAKLFILSAVRDKIRKKCCIRAKHFNIYFLYLLVIRGHILSNSRLKNRLVLLQRKPPATGSSPAPRPLESPKTTKYKFNQSRSPRAAPDNKAITSIL